MPGEAARPPPPPPVVRTVAKPEDTVISSAPLMKVVTKVNELVPRALLLKQRAGGDKVLSF